MSPNPVTTRERLSLPLTWHYVGLGRHDPDCCSILASPSRPGLVRNRFKFE